MAFLKSLVLVLLSQVAFSQNAMVDIRQKWNTYQNGTLQEKIYVHTDKNEYVAGEIICFKLYDVDAAQNKPSGLSKVAYIEVLDADKHAVMQAKISLKAGSGSGSFFIPLSAVSGNYKLRSYTIWMKNFSTDQLFEKPIAIFNTLKNLTLPATYAGAEAVQLFPEGGNLVNGLESRVALKVTGRDGKGVDFFGAVVNEKGDTVSMVKSSKFGIGNFSITPAFNHTYYAAVTTTLGRTIKKELPQAYEQGYVMRVDNSVKSKLAISVTTKGNNSMQNNTVYLFATNRQVLQSAGQKQLENGQAQFTFNVDTLSEGITQFTLFTEDRKPVCERLYFKKPVPKIKLNASTDQQEYGSRKKVDLTIGAAGATDSTGPLDLSLSVYKWDSLQTEGTNILTYLYLSSELTGTVEAPGYYFSDSATTEATDNLMVTQGWRRFGWKDIATNEKPAFRFPLEYNGHLISAVVTDVRTGKPAPKVSAFLSIPGSPFQSYVAQSDSAGIARFYVKNYYGPGEIIFQTDTQYDSIYRIETLSPFAVLGATDALPALTFSKAHAVALLHQSIGMQTQQIYRSDSLAQFRLPEVYDTVPFFGHADYSYALDVYTRFQTMEEVLREYVQPVNVVQRRGGLHMLIFDNARRQFFDGGELVLLDGIPIFDKNKIFGYDPLKVKNWTW